MDKRKLNNETGITIIALSITIIVMLILAGISIATVSPMIKNSEDHTMLTKNRRLTGISFQPLDKS